MFRRAKSFLKPAIFAVLGSRAALGPRLRELGRSGALDVMQREGIDTISYFQVDNPLVRCIDPAFVG